MTCRLEHEVIAMLARMVGFLPAVGKAEEPGGYLCSGGTTANIYSLWVARNLRTWPLALRVAIANAGPPHAGAAALVRDLQLPGPRGTTLRLAESSAWELWNVPIQGAFMLKGLTLLRQSGDPSYETDGQQERDRRVGDAMTLQALGEQRFYQRWRRCFPMNAASGSERS
jgi:hypothetical protein